MTRLAGTNLALSTTSFVGRNDDLDALARLTREGHRIITVLGPGGVGKTRLAREHARRLIGGMEGVWFCDLSEARDDLDIAGALARAVGVGLATRTSVSDAMEELADALGDKGGVLVVLDNFEQLVAHAPSTVVPLAARVPTLQLLVTSRERLRVDGEAVLDLSSLREDEAFSLFGDRARAVRRDFDAETERDAIGAICRELDGMPLAIELAAARMRVMSASDLASRLTARFELLTSAPRGSSPRHATLRAALDWSWELLAEHEQALLAQCATFEGGFSLEAAEGVLRGQTSVIDTLEALRDKSLLNAHESVGGLRFSMYATIREYARERLAELDPGGDTELRHAAHYLERGIYWAARAESRLAEGARAHLDREQDNLLAVHRRATACRPPRTELALRAAIVLQPVLITQGPIGLRLALLDSALATMPPDPTAMLLQLAAWAELARADCALLLGRLEASERSFDLALSTALAHGDRRLEGRCLWRLGTLSFARGADAAATAYVERALDTFRQAPDRTHEGRALCSLGLLHAHRGELDRARQCYDAALVVHQEVGDRRWLGTSTGRLGELDAALGHLSSAERLLGEALVIHTETKNLRHRAQALTALAALEQERGAPERALAHYEAALTIQSEVADGRAECFCRALYATCLAELGRVGDAATGYERALSLARAIQNPDLIALCHGLLARHHAEHGERLEARAALRAAEAALADVEARPIEALLSLFGAHVAACDGEPAMAREVLVSVADMVSRSALVRRAALQLERCLATEAGGETLVAAASGAWFRPAGGERVELAKRRSLKLLLAALARQRIEQPGATLSIEALFEAGWPGERAQPDAATSRVYVALSTLRKMGLRDSLVKEEHGYLLDPAVPFERWAG